MREKYTFVKCSLLEGGKQEYLRAAVKEDKIIARKSQYPIPELLPDINEERISATYVSIKYPDTLRSFGMIFKTDEKPNVILALDAIFFTTLISELKIHHREYKEAYIEKLKKFVCNTIEELEDRFPTPRHAYRELKELMESGPFREEVMSMMGRLHNNITSNEIIFNKKSISIEPVAVFGITSAVEQLFRNVKHETIREWLGDFKAYEDAIDYFKGKKPEYKKAEDYFDKINL